MLRRSLKKRRRLFHITNLFCITFYHRGVCGFIEVRDRGSGDTERKALFPLIVLVSYRKESPVYS